MIPTLKEPVSIAEWCKRYSDLSVEKMKMDKQFSIFLDNNKLDENDVDTEEWATYKAMRIEYSELESKLSRARFYSGK